MFDFLLSFRSWSSQTSLLFFTVFTLSLLPKLLAWTQCLWRARAALRLLGFLRCLASLVTHRLQNWNTPLDRCCCLRTSFKRPESPQTSDSWTWIKAISVLRIAGCFSRIKDLLVSITLDISEDFRNYFGPDFEPLLWKPSESNSMNMKWVFVFLSSLRQPHYYHIKQKLLVISLSSLSFFCETSLKILG